MARMNGAVPNFTGLSRSSQPCSHHPQVAAELTAETQRSRRDAEGKDERGGDVHV
jgi:hypothetical protein